MLAHMYTTLGDTLDLCSLCRIEISGQIEAEMARVWEDVPDMFLIDKLMSEYTSVNPAQI